MQINMAFIDEVEEKQMNSDPIWDDLDIEVQTLALDCLTQVIGKAVSISQTSRTKQEVNCVRF